MSIENTRNQNIIALNELVQDNGNMNVLLVHAIAEHVGLSAAEFECCDLIQKQGPLTAGELARRCHITSGGMTGMIDRLERAGFVKRSSDPTDRRRVLVTAITEGSRFKASIQKIIKLYGPMQEKFDAILAELSDEQITFLVTFMTQSNAMFRATLDELPQR